MGVRRAALCVDAPHAGSLSTGQAARFAELLQAGEARLAEVTGVAWWREWTWRRCVRRSGDATTVDSGLLALVLRGEITLDELDEVGAIVTAITDDAGLWIEAERAGMLGASRFGAPA